MGKTTRWEKRIKEHLAGTQKRKSKIDRYLAKYGPDRFEFSIIDTAISKDELNAKEKHYIVKLNTLHPNGYNLTEGGDGGLPHPEVKQKISNALKNRQFSTEHKIKLRNSKLGDKNPNFGKSTIVENFGTVRKGTQHPNYGRRLSQCKRGHFLTSNNTLIVSTSGERRCKECHRARSRKSARTARQKARRSNQ